MHVVREQNNWLKSWVNEFLQSGLRLIIDENYCKLPCDFYQTEQVVSSKVTLELVFLPPCVKLPPPLNPAPGIVVRRAAPFPLPLPQFTYIFNTQNMGTYPAVQHAPT